MKKNVFNIDDSLTIHFRAALFSIKSREDRDLCRQFARNVLNLAYMYGKPYTAPTFTEFLKKIGRSLTDKQQSLVIAMCLDASTAYHEWRQNQDVLTSGQQVAHTTRNEWINYGDSSLHGGSGYTGRLTAGFNASHGAESYQSDDDPRQVSKAWVNAVMRGGNSPIKYSSVSPAVDLYKMPEDWLRLYMARATDPGTFVRAVIAYYKQDTMINLGNISVDSTKINDPENEETISNLDSIYRFLKNIDRRNMMSEKDQARFLLLCDDFLSKNMSSHSDGEKQTSENADIEKYRARHAASLEIKHELELFASRFSLDPIRQQIDRDREVPSKKMGAVPSTSYYTL